MMADFIVISAAILIVIGMGFLAGYIERRWVKGPDRRGWIL